MELTDKCKADFKEWLKENYDGEKDVLHSYDMSTTYELFYWFPKLAKFGLIQAFADSKWIDCDVIAMENTLEFEMYFKVKGVSNRFETRSEAQAKAVELFNTNYNENL